MTDWTTHIAADLKENDELTRLRASLAAAEAKLADAEKHADAQNTTLAQAACSLTHNHKGGTSDCMLCEVRASIAVHAARRAARDGQEGTR